MRANRAVTLLALLSLLIPAVVACGDGVGATRSLLVLGPWLDDPGVPDDESDVFRKVLADYGATHDLDISYQGTRAIGQALRAKVKDGTLPDIAILPTVGELAGLATEGLAQPVTAVVRAGTKKPARGDQVTVDHRALWRGDRAYAVAIKTDVKSLIIHRYDKDPPMLTEPAGYGRATWCLGLSATSPGWPGTDWIEDLFLQQNYPIRYEALASGRLSWKETAPVWRTFARYLGRDPKHALLTSPVEAAGDLTDGRCGLMHQSSFYAPPGAKISRSGLLTEVSGDFAARFTTNPAAAELLKELATGAAGKEWVAAGAGRVVSLDPAPAAYDQMRRPVAEMLRYPSIRCLDASDAMPAAMADAFQNAVLKFVADPDRDAHLDSLLGQLDLIRTATQTGADQLTVRCSP
jgi:alpha-glucoside transport system substrate-binding protein